MKRSIEDGEIVDDTDNNVETCTASHRVFKCKTCDRQFSSFQALGGHQSSHTRSEDSKSLKTSSKTTVESCSPSHRVFECKICDRQFSSFQALGGHRASHTRPIMLSEDAESAKKMYKCSICGQEFEIGQALGGHMRKHWVADKPILKKSINNSRNLSFDLNLMPWENNL